jgi:hypothetical protein
LAVRLQLKLGAVTERDRLPDSPDTVVVVEPAVGSVARTKGNLYLLVTSRVPGARIREATRLVADTIRNEYYYDESAGIRQCLTKVLGVANKRLTHQRDRYGLSPQPDGAGPIGIAVAVVRGRELYVATVGPAEAYLIRQARLSTLPDPNRERGIPNETLEPDVWRGELSVGDSLCLISANVVGRIGTDGLKDALVTLHPQSAVEHVHALFVAADGAGSDGAIAFEAAEVGMTQRAKTLVPVRPSEPLAGAPDRSPIPLADSVTAGAAAIGAGATRARLAAGGGFQRAIEGIQDLLPRRSPGIRRVTSATSRVEAQRRAAIAVLAFVAIAATLALGLFAFGGPKQPSAVVKSITTAQRAFQSAQDAYAQVEGPGIDLIANDPGHALDLLKGAYKSLDEAENAGYPIAQITTLRETVVAGLDKLYHVVEIDSAAVYTFPTDQAAAALTEVVRGSDGAPYVLDSGTRTVWRIDLAKKTASAVLRAGNKVGSLTIADPRFLTTGGPDILILDASNVLWRWRPSNSSGKGTLVRIPVTGATSWGNDLKAIGTFVANFDAAFYKLYVVDPSQQNIMVLSPNSDGSGYSSAPTRRLPTDRPVDGMSDLLIDGDIYVAENGQVERVIPATGWTAGSLGDELLRPTANYQWISSPTNPDGTPSRRTGYIYAFDTTNHRIVAFNKSDGSYHEQYRLAGGDIGWNDLRGMAVLPGPDTNTPPTLWWISGTKLNATTLEASVGAEPGASGTPAPSGSGASASPSASARSSAAASAKP